MVYKLLIKMPPKNYQLNVRIPSDLADKVCLKCQERKFPSPDDHAKMIHFKSKAEFVEHLLRIAVNMGDKAWYIFVNMFDPYWRE